MRTVLLGPIQTFLLTDAAGKLVNSVFYRENLVPAEKSHKNNHRVSEIISTRKGRSAASGKRYNVLFDDKTTGDITESALEHSRRALN